MELMPAAEFALSQRDGAHSSRKPGAALERNDQKNGVDLLDVRASLTGKKRLFAHVEEDRTFATYTNECDELWPCPYLVKDCGPSFTILSNGAVLHDVPGYHTADFVYPVGYKGLRTFPSMKEPSVIGDFEFEIRYGGIYPQGGPLFCVRQFGYGEEIQGITPDEVWGKVVQKLREAGYQWKKGVNGHALFGLVSKIVIRQMELLPGIGDCAFYKKGLDADALQGVSPSQVTNGSAGAGVGSDSGGKVVQHDKAKLIKLQENYLQKQEQLMQRLELERKREEARERQRLEKDRHKALIEMQREEQRQTLEKSRGDEKIRRVEADAKRRILQKAHGRQIMIDDMELVRLRQKEEEEKREIEMGEFDHDKDKQDFLNSHQIEDVEQAPEAMRRASEQIPDLLEVWELVAFFAGILKCPPSVVGATFWDFCERMCHPKAQLFHWLHVVLVQEMFQDFAASDRVFLGRPLNALTWPELLRHYIEMLKIEQEIDGLQKLSAQMELEHLCDLLRGEFYEQMPFKTKLQMLMMNFHLAMETNRFRQYVEQKQDMLDLVLNEKRFEFERLRKTLTEEQNTSKIEPLIAADSVEALQQDTRPGTATSVSATPRDLSTSLRGQHAAENVTKSMLGVGANIKTEIMSGSIGGAWGGRVGGGQGFSGFAMKPAVHFAAKTEEKPISQMDGASSDDDEEEEERGGMVVDEDDDDEGNEDDEGINTASRGQDSASDDDDDSGDNVAANMSRDSLQGDANEDDDMRQGGEENGDPMSEEDDDDGDNEQGASGGGLNGGSVRQASPPKHGVGKGVMKRPPTPQKGGGRQVETDKNSKQAHDFMQAWCSMNNNQCYDKEILKIKGPEDEVSFSVHELYWSVQSFGGSSEVKMWKLAANDMVTRKTGRPCVPVPGRGYGYMPKAWEKWHLHDYERKYGASNVPTEYAKPAFVATRKAMLLASGLPLRGRRKQGGDLALSKVEKNGSAGQPSEKKPAAPRSRSGGAPRNRNRTGIARGRPPAGGGAGGVATPTGPPSVASPEVIFLLKLLESKTVVRGLTKEEMAIKRAVDHKHKRRVTHLRANTEALGSDRYYRKYWVLGNDYSVIWVQRPATVYTDEDTLCAAPGVGASPAHGAHAQGHEMCERMRRHFSVMTSAEQINRLLIGLDDCGVRENELIESIELYRQDFEAAMGAPIICRIKSLTAEPHENDKDSILPTVLAKTLASILPFSTETPQTMLAEIHSEPLHATAEPTGHWQRDDVGTRVWVTQSETAAAHATSRHSPEAPSTQAAQAGAETPAVEMAQSCADRATAQSTPVEQRVDVVSFAAKFLERTQPVDNKISPTFGFSQGLYAKIANPEEVAAQEHFGIVDDHHSAEAASLDLPACLCKIKGDLLLIEMAVHEEAVKPEFLELRPKWLHSVRDARTPAELLSSAREFIDNVELPWLQDWYFNVVRPWEKRSLPWGAPDPAAEEAAEAAKLEAAKIEAAKQEAMEQDELEDVEADGTADWGEGEEDGDSQGDAKVFGVGEEIESRATGYHRWWPSTVVKMLDDGNYEIRWAADPQTDLLKKPSEIRKKKARRNAKSNHAVVEPAQPLWDAGAALLVHVTERDEKAPVSTAIVALTVYGFDEALRYDRPVSSPKLAAIAAP